MNAIADPTQILPALQIADWWAKGDCPHPLYTPLAHPRKWARFHRRRAVQRTACRRLPQLAAETPSLERFTSAQAWYEALTEWFISCGFCKQEIVTGREVRGLKYR